MVVDKSNVSSLLSSSILVFVGTALTAVGTFVERIIIARNFDVAGYGEVSLGLAIMSLTVGISMVGLNQGVPRYISRFDSDADIRGVWIVGTLLAIAVSVVITAILATNVHVVAETLYDGTDSVGLLRLFILAIPLLAGFRMGLSTLRGFENTRYKFLVGDILYPVLRIALVAGLIFGGAGLAAAGYAYLTAAALVLVAVYVAIHRLLPLVGPVELHVRELVRFSAPLALSTVLAVLLTRTDLLMVGYFQSSSQAGLYSAAYSVTNLLLIVVGSLGYLYLPLTSRLDAEGDHEQIDELYQVTTKWGFVLSFPLFVVFVAFAGDVLSLTFGGAYRPASPAFVILAIGFFSDVAFGRNRPTLKALGMTKQILAANVIALGANVVLNVALIPVFGLVGAAVASTAAYLGRNAAMYATLYRQFGITPLSPSLVRTYIVLPATLLPVAFVTGQFLTLSVLSLPVVGALVTLLTLVTTLVSGCLRSVDLIFIETVEDAIGSKLPYIRRFVTS